MKYNFNEISRYGHDPDCVAYQNIKKILIDFYKRGMLSRFSGECIAAADILQHSLSANGIHSRIIECQLSIVNNDSKNGLVWYFIGFDNNLATHGIDTHAVVVTETEPPYMIDLSIGNTIGGERPWVVEKLSSDDNLILGKYEIDEFTCVYHPKINPRLVGLHQKTLLDRLKTDRKVEKNLKLLRIMVYFLIAIATINFLRGGYDFYQTYVIDTNNWGPDSDEKR